LVCSQYWFLDIILRPTAMSFGMKSPLGSTISPAAWFPYSYVPWSSHSFLTLIWRFFIDKRRHILEKSPNPIKSLQIPSDLSSANPKKTLGFDRYPLVI
jgi:hypothetical protein